MKSHQKIKTVVVDDNSEFLAVLVDHLSTYPDIELRGSATHYLQARDLLLKENPDLVFLDIVMPHKSGFDLLNEIRQAGIESSVIFHTAYDKYMIKALRASEFDYILKPLKADELRGAIERYKALRQTDTTPLAQPRLTLRTPFIGDIVALPTLFGIQFVDVNRILMFRSSKSNLLDKPSWEVLLTDSSVVRLSTGLTAEKISNLVSRQLYIQINQSCILNLLYLSVVEYKTRKCILLPPFDNIPLTVSRAYLAKLKNRFDVF